ncbi:restriction endonuclease [Alkalibacillus silvisoli]|uniref:Restriction endonuclease type IV Mrr domain-containing protein n=1 Tax=Alkalibacillus silvisoli TaxID=392823 RepID=A0ABP3K6R8_9BACI
MLAILPGLTALIMAYLVFMGPLQNIDNPFISLGLVIFVPIVVSVLIPKTSNKKTNKGKSTHQNTSTYKQEKNIQKNKGNDVPHNRMLNDDEILKLPLEKLSWREFERLCYLYFKDKGYKPQETSEGADGGVDLLIYNRHHQTYEAVQIKHYIRSGNEITVRELRELSSAKRNHNCLLARFITSSRFSNEAMKQADDFKVKTHSIDWLNSKVIPWKEQKSKLKGVVK